MALHEAQCDHAELTPAAATAPSTEVLIVGSCMGWQPIAANQAADYYRAFGWVSALGAGILAVFVFVCALNA